MVFFYPLTPQKKAYIYILSHELKLSTRQIAKKCNVSNASVSRISKTFHKKLNGNRVPTRAGRPKKITPRMERDLVRTLKKLRYAGGPCSSKKIALEAGIPPTIGNRTVRRVLNNSDFHWLQARKKGLMTVTDLSKRLKFVRFMNKVHSEANFFLNKIAFYLDGVSFVHKTRPMDQALAPRGRIWRKASEGLDYGCTAKGSSSLSGGRQVRVFVAISYGKGVILAKRYEHLDGKMFADFVTDNFPETFIRSGKHSNIFLQDGDPSQNSSAATAVFRELGIECFKIPPRSPDLNPIENLFHLLKKKLNSDAVEQKIVRENYHQFTNRVLNTLENFDKQLIDNIIKSMPKRLQNIKERRGQRLKY